MRAIPWLGRKNDDRSGDDVEAEQEQRREEREQRLAAKRDARRQKAAAKRRGERQFKEKSQLRAVVGNATLTQRAVTLWFVEAPVSTSFRPHESIEEEMRSKAAALSEFSGYRVYWRISTRPYGVFTYAEQTHADAVKSGEPLPGWTDFLTREQQYMRNARLSDKFVYFGIRIAASRRYPRDSRRELARLKTTVEEVTDVAETYGLEAAPASALDMEWLLHRSVALGLPSPALENDLAGDYDGDDLPELWERAEWTAEPGVKTIQVTGTGPTGKEITRHVAILTMGRMAETSIPQSGGGGWMQRTDRLDFPVEWMATVDILPSEKVAGMLRRRMDVIRDQYKHYTEDHGLDPPRSLDRQRSLALGIEDEVSDGLGGLASRTKGWYRLAVWGDSEKEALDKIGKVKKLYGRQVSWWHNRDQYHLAREFIPGEPLANTAAVRRMSVSSLAAALPAATAQIGDRYGCVMGYTSGTSRRAVIWHPWADQEGEEDRSGLMIVAGSLGSGKTLASASIVYRTLMAGVPWTLFDPSGRLGTLCKLPELEPYAQYLDLLKGRDGELSPYRAVAEPLLEHFDNRQQWEDEKQQAAAQRMSLCKDILRAFLPWKMRDSERAESVLSRAVTAVGGAPTAAPNQVLQRLVEIADARAEKDLTDEYRITARNIYNELRQLSESPKGRLIFPAGYQNDRGHAKRPKLTVYSLAGLEIPDAAKGHEESDDARMSAALFNLAAWLTQRSIYQGDPDERKGLMIDEGHMLDAFRSGRVLLRKSATDSRKHNTRVLASSQNATHFNLGDLGNLTGAALIGRTTDEVAARAALPLLDVEEAEESYVRILQKLSRGSRKQNRAATMSSTQPVKRRKWREFVFSDGRHGVEKIIYDAYAHPHLYEALNTTPDAGRAA